MPNEEEGIRVAREAAEALVLMFKAIDRKTDAIDEKLNATSERLERLEEAEAARHQQYVSQSH
jgi:hypothetical protein